MSDASSGWSSPLVPSSPPPPPTPPASSFDLDEYNNWVIIQRLCESPTTNDFIQHTKLWASAKWHTTDGIHFYLFHDTKPQPVTDVPASPAEEVVFLAADHLKWLASRPQKYALLHEALDSIRFGDMSSSDKVQRMRRFIRQHPLAIAKHLLIPLKDRAGRVTSFKYPEPSSRSARHVYRLLENLSLETFAEERFHTDLHRHDPEVEGWTSSESDG